MRTIESITTYNSGIFPNTLGVNSTGPSTKDGTELHANIFNDYVGVFPQALLSEMGVSPSGNAETATVCQQLDALKGLISRLGNGWGVIGRAAADTVHDVTLSVGAVPDSTRQYMLRLTAEITKQLDVAWSVGNNAGGLMGGSFSANTEYGMYLIYNPTTRVLDAGFSVYTGAGVPTFLPAGFTVYQMVDWVKTDATPNIIQTVTSGLVGGDYLIKHVTTPVLDVNVVSLSTSRVNYALGVPTGFEILATINSMITDASATIAVYVSYPGITDQAPSGVNAPLTTLLNTTGGSQGNQTLEVKTNTSRQISARGSTAIDTFSVSLLSYKWKRY